MSADTARVQRVLFIAGGKDRLAPPTQCQELARQGGWECLVIERSGHSVPIEQPRLWRKAVLDFLNKGC